MELAAVLVVFLLELTTAQDAAPDVGTMPGDLIFPVEADSSSNASIVSLPQLFPYGGNFTVTSLDYLSPTVGASQSSGALYLDDQMGLFRQQESLRKYLGGVFRLRVTVVSAETGIQTAEEIRLPVVDKMYRLKLVMTKKLQQVAASRFEIMAQLRNTFHITGRNLEFVPEKNQNADLLSGSTDAERSDFCFYVIQAPGFPLLARDILPQLQNNQSDLMIFFLEKYRIQRITYCNSDLAAAALAGTGSRMDGLSIGLLVLAIALSFFLVGAIIFVCCWIRMKKLHAAVRAAQPAAHRPAGTLQHDIPSSQFAPVKRLPPIYPVEAPLSISQWSALSLPTFSFGMMTGDGMTQQKPHRPPSSCDANYEWQESSLDLAGDADSVNRSINDAFNNATSSSAQSLTEDSVSIRRSPVDDGGRSPSPMNTQL